MKRLWYLTPPYRRIMYGIVLPGPDVDDGVPIVKGGDVSPERLRLDRLSRTTREIESGYARSRLKGGDLVYAIRGSIGEVAMIPSELEGANLTQDAARVAYTSGAHGPWLLFALKSGPVFAQLEAGALGATISGINIRDLKRACVPAPPPPVEQRAIAAFLDRETARIDALVARKERLIELLQEKRSALITRAVTKGLDPNVPMKDSGVEWLGEIPANWDTTFLDKLVDPLRRITYGIVQPGEPDPDGILMVRGQNYSRGWSRPDDIFRVSPAVEAPYRRARLKPGDIVMTIVGAGTGNVAIVPDWLERANLTQTTARIALDARKASHRYFAYQLQSAVGTVSVELTVKGAAQPGLNLGHISKYRVVAPPLAEQGSIADYLDRETSSFDALGAKVREAIERLQEFRTALVSAAVTGKIDVREEVHGAIGGQPQRADGPCVPRPLIPSGVPPGPLLRLSPKH